MSFTLPLFLIGAAGFFLVGAIVGSFANLCASRIPWEQSVLWPASRCDFCGARLRTFEQIPILGWIGLGGKTRCCARALPGRYPLVELATAVLFTAAFASDWAAAASTRPTPFTFWTAAAAHAVLVGFLMVIALIDFDLTIVPAPVTNLGMIAGLTFGMIAPGFRPMPSTAETLGGGLVVGLTGLIAGATLVWIVRTLGGWAAGGEAMGAGDIHILAVVGAFLGWRAAILTFFLSAFYGLIPSVRKLMPYLWKRLTGREWKASDHEIPLGPFLAMAAVTLMLAWPWLWPWLSTRYFEPIEALFTDAPEPTLEN